LVGNANFSYEFFTGFQLKANLGYNNTQMKQTVIYPISSQNPAFLPHGGTTVSDNSVNTWILEPQAEYQRNISKGKLDILLGITYQETINQTQAINASGYTSDALLENLQAAPNTSILNSNYIQYRYNGGFARINYNWEDKYLINITGRRDGSSRFGPGNQFGNFGAIGIGWIFSKEAFLLNNSTFLSFGKLRISDGTTGSDQIGDYEYFDTYSTTPYPYNGTSGLTLTRLVNPNYSWEKTRKFESALDLGFFKDRILISTTYYNNSSSNQLVGYPLPVITGQSSVQANLPATVQNTGWEFTLNSINIKSNQISWTTSINLTIPRNKLVSYPNLAGSSYSTTYVVGQPLQIRLGYEFKGVDPASGFYQFLGKDGKLTSNPVYPDDLTLPVKIGIDFFGGLDNVIKYKGFELDFFFQFVKQTGINYLGAFSFPGSMSNQPTNVLNHWQKPGDISNTQQYIFYGQGASSYSSASYYSNAPIADASFIRLKNLSLAYQLPSNLLNKIRVTNIRIFIQGQNLLTFTRYQGMDPEYQSFQYLPPLKVLTAGLQITL
jgi:TonB-linked SusC/RagA family outer membrane protein